ncbi:MAG: hypothetical protein ABIJ09_03240 [Pseudomonadota bacterium]
MFTLRHLSIVSLLALSACAQGEGSVLEQYAVELREKINTCRELDPQVSSEVIFVTHHGTQGVLHLGGELAFPVRFGDNSIEGTFTETDHATVAGRHVVCKRVTTIELVVENGVVHGTYERQRRQECLMDAKPCQTTWTVTGKTREGS